MSQAGLLLLSFCCVALLYFMKNRQQGNEAATQQGVRRRMDLFIQQLALPNNVPNIHLCDARNDAMKNYGPAQKIIVLL